MLNFLKPFATVIGVNVIGHVIYFFSLPIIMRIYSPEEFGVFSALFVILLNIGTTGALMYDQAIPVATDQNDRIALTQLSLFISLAICFISCVLIFILSEYTAFLSPNVGPIAVIVLSLAAFVQILTQLSQAWRLRDGEVVIIGWSGVHMQGLRATIQVALGVWAPYAISLLIGELLSRVGGLRYLRKFDEHKYYPFVSVSEMKAAFIKYADFPKYIGPSTLLDFGTYMLQFYWIGTNHSAYVLGQFVLAKRILDLPVLFISKSLSDMLYSRQIKASILNDGSLRRELQIFFALLIAFGSIVFLPLMVLGQQIFSVAFGKQWELSGQLCAILVYGAILNLATAPLTRVFSISNHVGYRVLPSLISFMGSLLLFFSNQYVGPIDILTSIYLITIITIFHYLIYFILAYVASGSIREILD
jgi:O-antigen/teichoic acid export membrane protein